MTYNQEPGPGASLEGGNYFPSQRNDEVSERTSSTSQSTILISPGMYSNSSINSPKIQILKYLISRSNQKCAEKILWKCPGTVL